MSRTNSWNVQFCVQTKLGDTAPSAETVCTFRARVEPCPKGQVNSHHTIFGYATGDHVPFSPSFPFGISIIRSLYHLCRQGIGMDNWMPITSRRILRVYNALYSQRSACWDSLVAYTYNVVQCNPLLCLVRIFPFHSNHHNIVFYFPLIYCTSYGVSV